MIERQLRIITLFAIVMIALLGIEPSHAFFPRELSNITTTEQGHLFQVWSGGVPQVSVTCDVNGDGILDLLEGTNTNVHVLFGQSNYNTSFTTTFVVINGTHGFVLGGFTKSVNLNCGDVNNDGFDDILVNDISVTPGKLYVVYGKASGWAQSTLLPNEVGGPNVVEFVGAQGSYQLIGYSPSTGDINGDGLLDLVLGCALGSNPSLPSVTNNVYVIYGINGGKFPHVNGFFNLTTLNGTNGFIIPSLIAYYSTVGDLNNDGIDDIIVNRNNILTYVMYGSRSIVTDASGNHFPSYNGIDGFIIATSPVNTSMSFIGVGDFNGDGFNDISFSGKGANYTIVILFGPFTEPTINYQSKVNSTNSMIFVGGTSEAMCQSHHLKDINGDGLADIQCSTSTLFYTIFGRYEAFPSYPSNISTIPTYSQIQDPCKGFYTNGTYPFSTYGDMNNDGVDDLLLLKYQQYYYAIYGKDYYNVSLPEEKNITVYQESSITQLFNSSNLINGTYNVINNGQCSYKFIKLKILNPVVGDTLTFNNPNTTRYGVSKNSTSTEITIYLSDLGNGTDSLILSALQYVYITPIDINENKTVLLLINNVVRQPIYFNVLSSLIPRPTVQPTSTPTSTPSPTPTSPPTDEESPKPKSKVGVIVGSVVGCAAAVLIGSAIAYTLYRRQKKKDTKEQVNMAKIYSGGKIKEIEQF